MNWTEVNIYTETEGIDILCASLMDIGIKGFVIKDSNDFKEFLENKNGKWDYIDDDLMNLSNCGTCLTVYLPDNSQGMEMMISLKTLLKQMKSNDKNNIFGFSIRFFLFILYLRRFFFNQNDRFLLVVRTKP